MSGKQQARIDWIRIGDIAASDLAVDTKIHLTAMAMEEVALALALVMIHGKERGMARYIESGGHVRFDGDGEPVIWAGGAS